MEIQLGLQRIVTACLAGVSLLLPVGQADAQTSASALNLLISLKQPFIAEPEAARIVLHIHNPTAQTLWLYRRARAKRPQEEIPQEENKSIRTTGGSTAEVRLLPVDAQAARTAISPAAGMVLEYVQMPKPRLIRVAAGGDYEETSIVHLQPAMAEGQKPIWGQYHLTVVYGASFSNGDQFERNLGMVLWQGETTSNTITVDLRPPLPDSVGTLGGTAVGKDLHPLADVRVSLSDEQGQLVDQQITAEDGKFSFAHLPSAVYWVEGRQEDATEDTVTAHHESSGPGATAQLAFFPVETDDPKKFVHKPVLIRVFDASRQPVGGIDVEAVFSNGQVIDDVKAVTGDDGTAAMELLPGRNSLSLKRRGCREQSERADVAEGLGVDSFKYVLDCAKK